jgi:hypothetical protein
MCISQIHMRRSMTLPLTQAPDPFVLVLPFFTGQMAAEAEKDEKQLPTMAEAAAPVLAALTRAVRAAFDSSAVAMLPPLQQLIVQYAVPLRTFSRAPAPMPPVCSAD